jgi:outer membrane protein TolC
MQCSTGWKSGSIFPIKTSKPPKPHFSKRNGIVAQARAGYFPTATVDASAQRSRGGGAGSGTTPVGGGGGGGAITNFFSTSTTASWTPDLWERVRRTVESNVARAGERQ